MALIAQRLGTMTRRVSPDMVHAANSIKKALCRTVHGPARDAACNQVPTGACDGMDRLPPHAKALREIFLKNG
jgi:hypothetical protein